MTVMNSENFIETIARCYKKAWIQCPGSEGARLYQAAIDYLYPNGQPLLKIKAQWLLNEAQAYVKINMLSPEEYKKLEDKLIQY